MTICSDLSKLTYLQKSLNHYNESINIIHITNWEYGNLQKIFTLKQFIKEKTQKDDIICFIDAYDLIINSNDLQNDLLNKFKSKDCNILISAEMNCYPHKYLPLYKNIPAPTNHKYLNSGGFIGYHDDLLELLEWQRMSDIIYKHTDKSDQGYFTEYYINNYKTKNIKLDHNADIFLSMHLVNLNDIIFKNNQAINIAFDNKPCFIHFNGKSYVHQENMMDVFINNIIQSKDSDNTLIVNRYKRHQRYAPQKLT